MAKFMTLFHTCIPDLYSYFEEEEVNIKEWAASALQFVLSRELTLDNTMRLWDTYFSIPDAGWIDLHPYFCLAILKHMKEGFEDLEESEIRTTLMRLPALDIDQVKTGPVFYLLFLLFCAFWLCMTNTGTRLPS